MTNTAASGTSTLTLAPLSGSISTFRGVIQNGTATVAVTMTTPGTQVIAGTDTYSGSTTITAGTLQLGSTTALASSMPVTIGNNGVFDLGGFSPTLASLTGTGIVFNGVGGASTLILSPTSGTSTYGGSIRDGLGTVALTISATGTEVLTGSSTYSGPTTISSGTLQLGNGGNTGSINGSSGVTDNTLLVFDVSGTSTFSPVISGVGNVTQNSGGVMILTASNTYSGLTTISNGTLQIGNGVDGSINNTSGFTGNGTLAYDLSGGTTLSIALTGGMGLAQIGTGTVIVTGNETYTGQTTIGSGDILQIGNNGTAGSINGGSISDSGTLAFDLTNPTTTFGRSINGTGGVTQMTATVLKLTGGGNYSGQTTISAGHHPVWHRKRPGEFVNHFLWQRQHGGGPQRRVRVGRGANRQRHREPEHRRVHHPHAHADLGREHHLRRRPAKQLGHAQLDSRRPGHAGSRRQ